MPAMIGQGLRNFADRTSDRSWVRSPISAMAIVEKAIRNTFMDCLGPSDDDNGSSPDGRRVRIDRWSRQCPGRLPRAMALPPSMLTRGPVRPGDYSPMGKVG